MRASADAQSPRPMAMLARDRHGDHRRAGRSDGPSEMVSSKAASAAARSPRSRNAGPRSQRALIRHGLSGPSVDTAAVRIGEHVRRSAPAHDSTEHRPLGIERGGAVARRAGERGSLRQVRHHVCLLRPPAEQVHPGCDDGERRVAGEDRRVEALDPAVHAGGVAAVERGKGCRGYEPCRQILVTAGDRVADGLVEVAGRRDTSLPRAAEGRASRRVRAGRARPAGSPAARCGSGRRSPARRSPGPAGCLEQARRGAARRRGPRSPPGRGAVSRTRGSTSASATRCPPARGGARTRTAGTRRCGGFGPTTWAASPRPRSPRARARVARWTPVTQPSIRAVRRPISSAVSL